MPQEKKNNAQQRKHQYIKPKPRIKML
uniref:Uncharacterized protein n=1 Tax=Rhizophora mucronata TaxID=61149 RepID=A0A2P2MMX3_RHIMU